MEDRSPFPNAVRSAPELGGQVSYASQQHKQSQRSCHDSRSVGLRLDRAAASGSCMLLGASSGLFDIFPDGLVKMDHGVRYDASGESLHLLRHRRPNEHRSRIEPDGRGKESQLGLESLEALGSCSGRSVDAVAVLTLDQNALIEPCPDQKPQPRSI